MALEVQEGKDIVPGEYMNLLVLGAPKIGKSCAVIATAEAPVFVINSDQGDSLEAVRRRTENFSFVSNIHTTEAMDESIRIASKLVREGKIKTVVWDTITGFAGRLENEVFKPNANGGEPDGRAAWYQYKKILKNFTLRLLRLECNVIVISHYFETGAEADGQISKSGKGIVPGLAGDVRAHIPAMFNNVVFMEKQKDKRVFITGRDGVWGPGCRALDGNHELPADLGKLAETFRKGG